MRVSTIRTAVTIIVEVVLNGLVDASAGVNAINSAQLKHMAFVLMVGVAADDGWLDQSTGHDQCQSERKVQVGVSQHFVGGGACSSMAAACPGIQSATANFGAQRCCVHGLAGTLKSMQSLWRRGYSFPQRFYLDTS
ncbi:hypothetical protein HPB50_014263 [Hyalomma asiaticum]|uniref:Uncharacterized protein n=1 Tax=Hyalomma asiaticum TaxID=266040 RepID=A0ACB7TKI1_HYAAI|nr:hypothetical protein HPB50_014263 [Hyalomma asiaticum]